MPPVLEVRGLSLVHRARPVLSDVDLEVREWEIVGLVGPGGSGKTALVDCISGFAQPDRGAIRLRGEDLLAVPSSRRVRLGLARSWQGGTADPALTVVENVLTAQHQHIRYSAVAGMLGTPISFLEEGELRQNAEEILYFLGLLPAAGEVVGTLAPDVRRTCDLALALATDPDILVLDDPFLGVSTRGRARLADLLGFVRGSLNLTILFTDRTGATSALCDYVYAMEGGRVLGSGRPGEGGLATLSGTSGG